MASEQQNKTNGETLEREDSNSTTDLMPTSQAPKKLPEIFKKNGYWFKLVKKGKHGAIYEQFDERGSFGWEVHKVRLKSATQREIRLPGGGIKIINYPKRKILACNEEFGKYAWYYEKYENALKKFETLTQDKAKKLAEDRMTGQLQRS